MALENATPRAEVEPVLEILALPEGIGALRRRVFIAVKSISARQE